MRKKIVAGNWKMNNDYQEGMRLFSEVVNMIKAEVNTNTEVIVGCPYIHLHSFGQMGNGRVKLSAQNCHHEEKGAYTGEVSVRMIESVGADYVIVGHSERRQYFNENNAVLAKKTTLALRQSLIPIFCIGETRQERESGRHFDVVKEQLREGLFHLVKSEFRQVVIAYEPVWAIGTGLTASPGQAQEMHAFIRNEIAQVYNEDVASETSLLYGGSCNPQNAPELFSQPDIDGGLIGGASLKARDFTDIAKVFNDR
ncbi:MAG TPA: triose-phosphate isomerase [Anseongella sp.]|nr:triose-phosphate isomerase [Anseongella sp.]